MKGDIECIDDCLKEKVIDVDVELKDVLDIVVIFVD
jgi:hypothetical protein